MTPIVSIIIPCYNEETTITKLLQAIKNQTFPIGEMEVIIADGFSNDLTREKINEFKLHFPELAIKLIDNPQKNIPSALNTAIDHSEGEFIIRLDAHSVPSSDYVMLCIDNLKANIADNVGGVWKIMPGGERMIAKAISLAAAHPLGVGDALYRYASQPAFVDTVPFGAFRRTLVEKIGKYDETLLTNEDYEFNVRVRRSGGKVYLDPKIHSIYFARKNLIELARQYWRYGFWKYKMLRRYPETIKWRQALPPVFVLSLMILFIGGIIYPPIFMLFGLELLIYLLVLLLGAVKVIREQKNWKLLFGIPIAIATMHLFWGSGFLWSMVNSFLRK